MIDWDKAPEGAVAIKQDCGKWKKVIWIHADGSWWNDNDAEWNPEYDESKWVQTIAVRPVTQTKTVADAVEYYKKNGKICGYSFSQNKMLSFCKSNGTYCFVSDNSSEGSVETDDWQPICTRAEFEAYVKEQEGEKWTHVYRNNECRVIHQEKFNAWIEIKGSGERIVGISELRKPKPPISESELLDKIRERAISIDDDDEFGAKVRGWLDEYDII